MTNPPEAAALDEWLPIETAPKDGANLLLFARLPPTEFLSFAEPQIVSGYYDACDQAWCSTVSTVFGPFVEPTHWKPLPAPPVRENAQPPAEPDQDDADLKTILNAYWPDDGNAYVECPLFANAKAALIAIKDRVRDETIRDYDEAMRRIERSERQEERERLGKGTIETSEDVRMLEAAALVILAQFNIPTDVQEVLVSGRPGWNVRPGALAAALKAVALHSMGEERETVCKWLREKSPYSNTTFHLDAAAIERGDHRDTRP